MPLTRERATKRMKEAIAMIEKMSRSRGIIDRLEAIKIHPFTRACVDVLVTIAATVAY